MKSLKSINVLTEKGRLITFRCISCFIFLFIAFSMLESCRQVNEYHGKSVVISKTTDNSLSDSVLIFGKVFNAIDNKTPVIHARIWVTELTKDTYSDSIGSYSLKLPSGVYTVNCKECYGSDEFIEIRKDVSLLPNEKIEIYFFLGSRSE